MNELDPLFDDDRNILVKQKFKVVWMGFDFGWLVGWLAGWLVGGEMRIAAALSMVSTLV